MKKNIFICALILLSANSFSSIKLSSDEYLKGVFTSNAIKSIMEDSYDYNNDLAVASDRLKVQDDAINDALNGLKGSISDYSSKFLINLLKDLRISGHSFDEKTMRKMANELAEKIIENKGYTIGKVVKTEKKDYIVLAKIDRKIVEKESRKVFKQRLKNVILRLNDYYNEIKD